MADDFGKVVDDAVRNGIVAGGAAVAMDKTGRILVEKAFGKIGVEENDGPFTMDTVMWVASCTKLMTSVAALQCVERGFLKLDDPIATIIPEWTEPQILTGFDEDLQKPILTAATTTLTLRHLLTHSAGMAYPNPMVNPLLSKCFGEPFGKKNSTVKGQFLIPLVYEPGERWEYSPGLEWAGKMVEKANGGMKLSEYLQKNMWDPLGMKSTTFHPLHRPDLMERMVGRVRRAATGLLEKDDSEMFTICEVEDDFGGDGSYTCARDFILILKSLLSDDGLLLGPEMRRELFRGQLARPEALQARMEDPIMGPFLAPGLPRTKGSRWDYACGGAVVVDPIEAQSGRGLLYWSGLPNSFWFIDRETGTCGFYGSRLLPPGDAATGRLFAALQKAAYAEAVKRPPS